MTINENLKAELKDKSMDNKVQNRNVFSLFINVVLDCLEGGVIIDK